MKSKSKLEPVGESGSGKSKSPDIGSGSRK